MGEPADAATDAKRGETLVEKAQLEEFKILRAEVELRGTEQRVMERYVIVADAAIYSVLVFPAKDHTIADPLLVGFVWFLPPIIGFLALIRWRESIIMIETLAEFLRRREAELFGAAGSWEWFLFREKRKDGKVRIFSFWYEVYWSIVIGGTAAIACYKNFETYRHRTLIAIVVAVILLVVTYMLVRRPKRSS